MNLENEENLRAAWNAHYPFADVVYGVEMNLAAWIELMVSDFQSKAQVFS